MIDVDETLRAALDGMVSVRAEPDWERVVLHAGLKRERAQRRLAAGSALIAVAATLSLATPLRSAIAHGLSGFSAWLTGRPGTPAPAGDQRAFARANAHSWLGFPEGTELRQLVTVRAGAVRIRLLGFRSGSSALCLRLSVTGRSTISRLACAPLADLRNDSTPVQAVLVDAPVGKGAKVAWYGIDRVHSANLQITAGIAADGVTHVILQDAQGRHAVPAVSNAFVYVARDPEVGQRVSHIWARLASGRLVTVPFSPAPFETGFAAPARHAPVVPVELPARNGRIGWLDRHETRGLPLTVLPARLRDELLGYRGGMPGSGLILFGRILTPNHDLPLRLAVTLNATRTGGSPRGLCVATVTQAGGGGGCSPYPEVFAQSPISYSSFGSGASEVITISGMVSDAVAHLELISARGQKYAIGLVDNAFLANVRRPDLPARLVALDRSGRVVGVSDPLGDLAAAAAGPALGRATVVLKATAEKGAHAEILVGRSTAGGRCVYVRAFVSRRQAGATIDCRGEAWVGPPLQLDTTSQPPLFLSGQVRPDVATLRLRFADGTARDIRPTRGLVLFAPAPPSILVGVTGLNSHGGVVGSRSFARRG